MMLAPFIVPGVAIPEEIRRTTDVTVSLTIAGISVTTSIGPVTHRAADPLLGVQTTAVSGAPAVTLAFERGLEWIPAGGRSRAASSLDQVIFRTRAEV
jgi:hypothetical protein